MNENVVAEFSMPVGGWKHILTRIYNGRMDEVLQGFEDYVYVTLCHDMKLCCKQMPDLLRVETVIHGAQDVVGDSDAWVKAVMNITKTIYDTIRSYLCTDLENLCQTSVNRFGKQEKPTIDIRILTLPGGGK